MDFQILSKRECLKLIGNLYVGRIMNLNLISNGLILQFFGFS